MAAEAPDPCAAEGAAAVSASHLEKARDIVISPIAPEERAAALAALARLDALDLAEMILGDDDEGGPQ